MQARKFVTAAIFAMAVPLASIANAQSVSSDKAFFVTNTAGVTLIPVGTSGTSAEVEIVRGQMKTSSVGSILAGVSMECAVWTDTVTTATSGGGKSTATASAAVRVNVYVDGVLLATPSPVTFCSRLQAVSLTVVSSCLASSGTCTVTDTITLDLFQATKDANHYNFYQGNIPSAVHTVVVKAIGTVVCTNGTTSITCPTSVLGNGTTEGTQAAIGKATLVLEDFNNSNL
jgi:hypothetical protein